MKKTGFKIFKWFVEFKIKDLSSEQKCEYLANRLLQEYEKTGLTLRSQNDFASLNIYAFKVDTDKILRLSCGSNEDIRLNLTTSIK